MKILYISSFIYKKNSSASIRNNKLIEGLVSLGVKVDVLSVMHPDEWTDMELLQNHNDISVHKILSNISSMTDVTSTKNKSLLKKYLPKTLYTIIKNLLAYPDFDKKWLESDFNIENKYDYVVSSSDSKTSHFLALNILKQKKMESKWIQIWGDPWSSDINLDFITKKRAMADEYNLLKKADKIFYVSELTSNQYKKKFPEFKTKIYDIGRSYYKEVYKNHTNKNSHQLNILYTGSLNNNRSIVNFCNDLHSFNINNKINIKLKICGYQEKQIYERYKNFDFIEFMGSKSISQVYNEFSKSDFLLFVDNGNESTQIPGKIFDYYGTELPIIALISSGNTNLKELLSKEERNIIVDKYKSNNLDFLINSEKKYVINTKYSPQSIAKRLLDVL